MIGPIAKPANIVFTPELPKTRSGKIMRRLLRDVAENRPLGDTTTLADPAVVDEIRLQIHPLVLGSGIRLLGDDGTFAAFDLVDATTTKTGVVAATYRRSTRG